VSALDPIWADEVGRQSFVVLAGAGDDELAHLRQDLLDRIPGRGPLLEVDGATEQEKRTRMHHHPA